MVQIMGQLSSQKLLVILPFEQDEIDRELSSITDEKWVKHVNHNVYQGDWSVVPLRTLKRNKEAHPILQSYQIEGSGDWVDLPILQLLPNVRAMLSTLGLSFQAIRLMKLASGAQIFSHKDQGLCIENGEARLHIPLQTNTHLEFISHGKLLDMQVGELWYVNADQQHSVTNKGRQDRINLVVDCLVDDKLMALL